MPAVIGAIGSAWTAVTGAIGSLGVFGQAVLRLGASAIFSAIAQRMQRRKQPEIRNELGAPNSRPPVRFVYGYARVQGSPAPWVTKGTFLYGCLILNSRPSAGTNITIFFDGREAVVASGDMLDFSDGAILAPLDTDHNFGAGADRPKVWLGLGDQTGPPAEILTDAPDLFLATDAWRGRTVLWIRIGAGPSSGRIDRWPRTPPQIDVEGNWSLVWDPRDEAQDPADPATWTWSNNQALCLLDALRNNPIRRRPLDMIHLPSFEWGADIADEAIGLKAGGTVPRYTANGILVWDGAEAVDQIKPIADAGAGELAKFNGLTAYSPGRSRAASYTVTDILSGAGFSFDRMQTGDNIPVAVKASYIAPQRDWQEAELPLLLVGETGGTIEDGITEIPLTFVTEPTQAMRIQKIVRNRLAAQKRISMMLPPSAINLVPGAVMEWGMAELPRCAGNWRVTTADPAAWTSGDGVAMAMVVKASEEPPDFDAWDPEDDEFDLVEDEYAPPARVRIVPVPVSIEQQDNRLVFLLEPVENAVFYEWQFRLADADWRAGGLIDGSLRLGDNVPGNFTPDASGTYEVRVRAIFSDSGVSGWAEFDPVAYTQVPPEGFTFVQSTPATVWTINHNFGRFPQITLYDDTGEAFGAVITNPTVNQTVVTMTEATSGSAQLY